MVKTKYFGLSLLLWSTLQGGAIAQTAQNYTEGQIAPTTSLTGTIPASIENNGSGLQINNGTFNGTLTVPSCASRVCLFGIARMTPQGNEAIIGAIFNLGGSADEERAVAEKLRVEMEGAKNTNDYKLQLLDKLVAAIDSGNSVKIRSIAITLAPLEGYKDFREYLNALLNEKK
ncbi:hypothetical protein V2H45_15635 [Tumidithrix elongata RA019]|uniref:Uncharacterized protein n=1 Tax=Tumidithrix elongata BACA0141 TaxID=2716417 RepID=A0AAW9PYR8_9CYAN|nr:hypothetical protein [Tumidithrix elongata RA019]